MKYALLLYADMAKAPQYAPEERIAAQKPWYTLLDEMKTAGVYVENYGLAPVADATTVRVRNGKTVTTDGPFAETTETLVGYWLLDCKDLDEAMGWAAKMPHATGGSVEIRPAIAYTEQMANRGAGR